MYKSLEDLERVISLGKPEKVIDSFLESYLQGEEKKAWLKVQEAEHKTLYPETIPNPDYVAEVPAVGEEWIDNLDGTFTANPDYIPAVPAIGDEFIPNPDFISFDEWMQETVVTQVAQDAVYDAEGILVTPAVAEVTELAREFVEVDVSAKAIQWRTANYVMLREASYPSIYEFMDAYVKDDVTGIQAYKDKCLANKIKYPKGV